MKKVVSVTDDELLEFAPELRQLMDALSVEPEIREAHFSDESVVADLFDVLTTRAEIEAHLRNLDLPIVSPSALLIEVLREMRQLQRLQ